MANALGRISGQLLKDNLTRSGNDLKFDEFGSTDPLLNLNVTGRYISVNSDTTFRPLFVNGKTFTSNLISLDGLQGSSNLKLSVNGNTIVSIQDLNLFAATQVNANIIDTDNIRIDGNVISTKTLNTVLDITPAGSLDIYNKLNVTGNLWAKETAPGNGTGRITLDGNITFGSDGADTISFAADINTDINPNVDELYSIGSTSQKWEGLYTALINGQQVSSTSIASGGIDLASRQGKIWYVASNGLDTNVGDHQNGAFATIREALLNATAGDTVYIYPGTYTEITPLTIPVGVTVKGTGIRSVTVVPDATTDTETVFLINGESTISDLTVKDFYAPGYAFAFAPGFTVTSRSPYVQNITVITKGSVISPSDPRGFDEGDAGGGARVDGSLATASSKEASMLFHSVTFITPGVDALVMTNGVRVEWLNSFSYFANRGIYATQGTLGLASLGVRFGAEIRSIGSANVYGNYGAEANGASTLMYLIQHNFAYIGAGKDVTNDPSLNIAANETVELAAGKIYYQSLDNKGNFKVGDAFGVSFDTGRVTISGVSVSAGGVTSINFAAGTDETVIDATQVTVNNVTFSDNLISTLSGPVNLDSGTGEIKLNANTDVTDNLIIDGNFNIDGQLTIGNAYIDIVRFEAPVEFDLRPVTDDDYTLGGPTNKSWDFVYLDTSYIGSYKLENATISTLPTNADVELRADTTGKIYVPTNNVEFDNDLTVDTTTALKLTIVTGEITQYGDYYQTGNTLQTGNREITNTLDVTNNIYFDNINIVDNRIFTTNLNDSLELRAAGTTGKVIFNEITEFSQNALFGTLESNGLGNSGTITSDIFSDSDIEINDNYITTTVGNNDLRLVPNGIGKLLLPLDPLAIDQALTVEDTSTLKSVNMNGNLVHVGTTSQTGNVTQTGNFDLSNDLTVTGTNAFFTDVRIINNSIATSTGNNNLELRANGTGIINITDFAAFGQTLTVNGITSTTTLSTVTGTITSDIFTDSDIEINDNYITTTVGNNNLILTANGTGGLRLEKLKFNAGTLSTESNNDSIILSIPAGNLLIDSATALKIPVGTTVNRPTLTQGELRFDTTDNLFRGYSASTVTFAGVYSADRLTKVLAHPTNNTIGFTTNNSTSMTVSSTGFNINALAVDNLLFNNSTISSTATNTNITLNSNGTGYVKIGDIALETNEFLNLNATNPLILQNTGAGYIKFAGTYGLAIPSGDINSRPLSPETGDLRWNTELSEAEVFNGVNYQALSGSGGDLLSAEEVQEATNLWALVLG
jgi:hypothetical protein